MSGTGNNNLKSNLSGQHVAIGQAAKYLGVSVDTIRRWERSGKLTAHRLDGKNRHFLISDLEQYKNQKQLSTLEVAAMLKISESTVRRLEKDGMLVPARTDSGKRLYSPLAVSNYITSKDAPKQAIAVLPIPSAKPIEAPSESLSARPARQIPVAAISAAAPVLAGKPPQARPHGTTSAKAVIDKRQPTRSRQRQGLFSSKSFHRKYGGFALRGP